jgi:hypothetical protein
MVKQNPELYIVEYEIDDGISATNLNAAGFAGLRSAWVFDSGSRRRLLTTWDSQQSFQAIESAFAGRLTQAGKPAVLNWKGKQTEVVAGPNGSRLLGRSLERLRDLWRQECSVPYVAEYLIDLQFDLEKVRLNCKGLLYVQVLVNDAQCRLLTFWSNQQSFLAAKDVFPKRVGLDPAQAPIWQGLHRDAKGPRAVFWKTWLTALWAAVATFFLILGYFDKLKDTFVDWFLPARAAFSLPDKTETDALVGDDFDVDFEIYNRRSLGTCDVHLEQAQIEPSPGSPSTGLGGVHLSRNDFGGLKASEKQTARVSGKAERAGVYGIKLTGNSKSGLLFPPTELEPQTRTLHVWRAWQLGERKITQQDKRYCIMEFDLHVGKTMPGLKAIATLKKRPGYRFGTVISQFVQDQSDPEEYGGKGSEVSELRWQFGPLEKFKKIPFKLELDSENVDRALEDWKREIELIDIQLTDKQLGKQ